MTIDLNVIAIDIDDFERELSLLSDKKDDMEGIVHSDITDQIQQVIDEYDNLKDRIQDLMDHYNECTCKDED